MSKKRKNGPTIPELKLSLMLTETLIEIEDLVEQFSNIDPNKAYGLELGRLLVKSTYDAWTEEMK